ncbi:MAG: cysteine desulfurase [Candidatus Paracaedibacteraceae bacterium]|nr:cysteine desulfurase [Candidatus Paracaedibacteraceae bacterium]
MRNTWTSSIFISLIFFISKIQAEPIYLDYQASTPVDPRVFETMVPYFTKEFGNPHSTTHIYGIRAHKAVEQARAEIAKIINAQPEEIIFTSGATEANNLAILGACRALKHLGKNEIISVSTEHKSVLEPLQALKREGFKIIILPVQKNGLLRLEDLVNALSSKTILVSVMAANNEIGVLQPIKEISKLAQQYGALFHTDAAQAYGKIPIDVVEDGIDLLSISGHKIYGPKGVGALYIKKGVTVLPLSYGGGQERNLRPGTLPTPLCVGLGEASRIAYEKMQLESQKLITLRNKLLALLQENLPDIILNGDLKARLPGNINISIKGVDGRLLLSRLTGIAASVGSACTSANIDVSYVIQALDPEEALPPANLRISLGRYTTEHDVDQAASEIIKVVKSLREKYPKGGRRSCLTNIQHLNK